MLSAVSCAPGSPTGPPLWRVCSNIFASVKKKISFELLFLLSLLLCSVSQHVILDIMHLGYQIRMSSMGMSGLGRTISLSLLHSESPMFALGHSLLWEKRSRFATLLLKYLNLRKKSAKYLGVTSHGEKGLKAEPLRFSLILLEGPVGGARISRGSPAMEGVSVSLSWPPPFSNYRFGCTFSGRYTSILSKQGLHSGDQDVILYSSTPICQRVGHYIHFDCRLSIIHHYLFLEKLEKRSECLCRAMHKIIEMWCRGWSEHLQWEKGVWGWHCSHFSFSDEAEKTGDQVLPCTYFWWFGTGSLPMVARLSCVLSCHP